MPRRADTPCSRCGKMLWSSSASLAADKRVCHLCRKIEPAPYGPTGPRRQKQKLAECVCVTCSSSFLAGNTRAMYCSEACRPYRSRIASPMDRERWSRRGSSTSRGYNSDHRRVRSKLLEAFCEGDPCCRCQLPMYSWQRLDADHFSQALALGGTLPDALAHASCNRRAGAALGNRMRRTRRDSRADGGSGGPSEVW